MSNPLRIVSLNVQNVMGVKAVHIEPQDDSLIIVGGDNGAGKTSTIDSIWFALGGKPSVSKPIRAGETEAKIELDLGSLKVIRTFRDGPKGVVSNLEVTTPDGANYKSPQSLLDELYSKFAFDPFEFVRLKEKDQVARLRTVLGCDTSALDAEYAQLYHERTSANKILDHLKAKNAANPDLSAVPEQPIDLQSLREKWDAANEHNRKATQANTDVQLAANAVSTASEAVRAAEIALEEAKARLERAQAQFQSASQYASLQEHVDIDALRDEIERAKETNALVARRVEIQNDRIEYESKAAEAKAMTDRLKEIEAEKSRLASEGLAKAQIPVAGLTWTDDGLYVGEIPFAQVNTADQIKTAVALALVENPRLRVFRISDGEKITPKNLEVLREIATAHDAQIWVESAVTREDVEGGFRKVSVLIEDGQVAS